jgi:pyruvate carboxylase
VVPTRYFLGKPPINEEMHISIDQGKTLIVKLLATGPINQKTGVREVFFELNGEVRAVAVEDKGAAIEIVQREKATSDPGSVGVSHNRGAFFSFAGGDVSYSFVFSRRWPVW